MLKNTKWKQEKIKIKAVFRLQFHATRIPRTGWDKLCVSFIPAESGKVTARTKKANARNGSCKWADPIYETTRLLQDYKTKKCDDKIYKFVVSMGMSRSGVLGEAEINIAEFYEEASKPVDIALPLHGIDRGSVLHVTLQLLTSKTGFREFEQQSEMREQSLVEENTEVETEIRSDGSDFSPKSVHPEHDPGSPKNTDSRIFSGDSSGPSADSRKGKPGEASGDLRGVVSSLEISVDDIENGARELEAGSSRLLSKQASSLEFERSDSRRGLKFLEVSKPTPRAHLDELASVEDGLRDLHKKALLAEDDISTFLCPDIDAILETLQNFKLRFENEPRKHALEAEMLRLEAELGESVAEQGILESRILELERGFENFVHETGEINRKMAAESKSLRQEYSTCIYTVSSAKSEVANTNRRVSGLLVEREGLVSTNRELERRAVCSEEAFEKARKWYSKSVGRLQSDLELLSRQVSSVFETGGRLMEETSDLSSENPLDSSRDIEYRSRKVLEPDTVAEISEGISGENSRLEEKIENLEREIFRLEEENRGLRIRSDSAMHEVEEEKARFFLEIGRLGSEIERREQEIIELGEENRGLRIRSDSEMREVREEKAGFFLEIGSLRSEIERREQEILLLEEENRCLKIESREAREEKARFLLEIGHLESEIENLEQEILQLKEEKKISRIRYDSEIQKLGEEKARFLLEIGRLESEIENREQEILQLKEEKAQFLLEIGRLETEIENLEQEIIQLKEEKARFLLEIYRLESEIENLEQEILQLKEEKARFLLEIGRLESEIENLEQEILQLKEEKARFLLEIGRLETEIENLEQEILQLREEEKISRIRYDSEIRKMGEEKARFLLEIGRLETEIGRLRVENGEFFVQMSILRAGCTDLEAAVEFKTEESITAALILDILTEKTRILENPPPDVKDIEKTENLMACNIMLEVRGTVLESELKARLSDLSSKLSEQILETEALRKIADRVRENPGGSAHETLRVALMREQYEVRIENLEQELLDSRTHGGETLLRLQEAADEFERRKKEEASALRKNEESLSGRLEICEREKRALETFLVQCREEIRRLRGASNSESVGGIEGLEEGEVVEESHCFKSTIDSLHSQLEMLIRENHPSDEIPTLVLKEVNDEVGPTCSRRSSDVLERVHALETQLALALNSTHNHCSREGELVEMQERYSKLSLKFAEVEGERQRLVMTLKNFKSLPL